MVRRILVVASFLIVHHLAAGWNPAHAQVTATSTWANITIDPQLRDEGGVPIGSPSEAAFDEWDSIPLAVADPADNPSTLNINDIADVKIANDSDFIYIYASGHKNRTRGLYLAFDTDQDITTGFDIYGLQLVGSELGFVSDFPFDQRTPGVFNSNQTNGAPDPGGSCCTGGPLDVNNGGAAIYPGWDVEFVEREWGIPLDAMWSVNEPFGPTFPNPTFNFIIWTDQGLTDVTDTITYTLATNPSPGLAGDFNGDNTVDAADYTVWRNNLGTNFDLNGNGDESGPSANVVDSADYNYWKLHYGDSGPGSGGLAATVPEPGALALWAIAALSIVHARRWR